MAEMAPCPRCGTANSTRKRICHHCQVALAPEPVTAPAPVRRVEPPPRDEPHHPTDTSRTTLRTRVVFYRQLAALLHSGMPMGQCLQTMTQRVDGPLRRMVRELAQATQDGTPLSTVMPRYPQFFPAWELHVMHSAELGGTLPESSRDIAEALEAELELRSRAASATFYLRITGSFMIFVIYLVIASRMSVAAGRVIDSLEDFLAYILPVFAAFGLTVAIYLVVGFAWRLLNRTRGGAIRAQAIIRRTPLIGPIMYDQQRFRFISILATLWGAGVGPVESIETAAKASGDPGMLERIADQLYAYSHGQSLSGILTATGAFPPEAIYLLQSGETAGNVPEMLRKVAEYLRIDLDYRMRTLPARLQFGMLLIVGPCVGYLFITTWSWFYTAMIDALSKLSETR